MERFTQVSDEKVNLQAEKERLLTRVAVLERDVKTNAILDGLIVPFAGKIYWFMCAYSAVVCMFLVYESVQKHLTERILALLVGSAAVTVVGLVGTIVAGIFAGARRSVNS